EAGQDESAGRDNTAEPAAPNRHSAAGAGRHRSHPEEATLVYRNLVHVSIFVAFAHGPCRVRRSAASRGGPAAAYGASPWPAISGSAASARAAASTNWIAC